MQLRLRPKINSSSTRRRVIVKTILFALTFFLGIFLLDKIEMPVPNKLIKQKISNDKLITVK